MVSKPTINTSQYITQHRGIGLIQSDMYVDYVYDPAKYQEEKEKSSPKTRNIDSTESRITNAYVIVPGSQKSWNEQNKSRVVENIVRIG